MYEVTIKKTVKTEMPASKSYERIADTGGEDNGPKYGYIDKPAYTKDEDIVVFQQMLETLDILATLAALNGLKLP
jgi:hypothetical protein